jgi:hypothetical protein
VITANSDFIAKAMADLIARWKPEDEADTDD